MPRFSPVGGEPPSHSPTLPLVGRMADAIGQFLGLNGLLKSLLDQLGFCMRDCANAQREGKGVDEE